MSSSGTTGSADNGAASAQTGKEEQQPQQPLALPWQDTATQPSAPVNIEVGGAAVQLDHLGPMVINTDGTVSRIANWAEMSEFERKATMRVIAKRNRERREVLQQQQELQGQHQE
ncbi:hypothetical protein BC828DRAFT_402710 [Blastocladiella britannica]|nr:hypothetical protein BC828DRAFT_402710 [Blastocladiella britannica]